MYLLEYRYTSVLKIVCAFIMYQIKCILLHFHRRADALKLLGIKYEYIPPIGVN